MTDVQYYDAEQVRQVLSWHMINEAITAAFIAVAKTEENCGDQKTTASFANQPPRSITNCGEKSGKLLFAMPAFVGNYSVSNSATIRSTLACKLVTSFPTNSTRNPVLPNILAHILLFSSETGQLESVVEGTQITAWRTASASIVATKYLYFGRETEDGTPMDPCETKINVAIIGCGVQGESHALGLCATYNIGDMRLWNRTKSKADKLAELLREKYPKVNISVSDNPSSAVAEADVICVGTYSPNALIELDMIKKDVVHINTVGAGQVHFGEVAQNIYDVAQVYIDSWENAKVELKDLKANIIGEVGEIIKSGKRPPKKGITIFQSMGMAAEDATVTHAVVEAIKEQKIKA